MEWTYFYLILAGLGVLGVFGIIGNAMRYRQLERLGRGAGKK